MPFNQVAHHSASSGRHTTHPCLHIRSAADAQVIFEAVRLNVLPMIRRRLGPSERDMLCSGEIFVWEETDQKGGLERWTDGRRWSQSRMREPFLYYEEKEPTTKEEKEAKAARRALKNDPNAAVPNASRRQDRPSRVDGLTKQTYSSFVSLGQTTRKWHLVAYFSGSDYMRLPVIEDYDYLRRIRVPKGIYISSKGLHMQCDHDEDDVYPSSFSPPPQTASSSRYYDHSLPYSNSGSAYGYTTHSPAYASLDSTGPYALTTTMATRHQGAAANFHGHRSGPIIPLTSEDRRALGAFRVAL